MKNNKVISTFFILIASLIIGLLLMVLTYIIPVERVEMNARNSVDLFSDNIIKTWSGDLRYAKLDTSTDATMVNNAICRGNDTLLDNALLNPRYSYSSPLTQDPEQEYLTRFLENEANYSISNYSRYWHGYLTFLVPLLLFFNVGQIRFLFMVFQLLLSFYIVCELNKKNKILAVAYSIVVCFICPITTSMNLAVFVVNFIMMLFQILVIKYKEFVNKNYYYVFLINGILIAFFDFFTYPIVALCIPLITMLFLINDSTKDKLKITLFSFISWIIGYLGMWIGKVLVSNILTSENTISDSFNRVLSYSGASNPTITVFSAIKKNFEVFDQAMISLLLMGFIFILFIIKANKMKLTFNKNKWLEILLLLIFVFVPIVWFSVIKVPTFIHPWYHYRNISIGIYALYTIVATLTKEG